MIKIEISAKKFELNPDLQKYTQKKLNTLEKYIPRSVRQSASCEVRFRLGYIKEKKQSTCELTLHLPHENLFAQETTQHMYAALDIAAAHIHEQLVVYKAKYGNPERKPWSS